MYILEKIVEKSYDHPDCVVENGYHFMVEYGMNYTGSTTKFNTVDKTIMGIYKDKKNAEKQKEILDKKDIFNKYIISEIDSDFEN